MRIATIAKIAGMTLACSFIAIVASGWMTLRELKVGGPLYHRIVLGKELVADVVPPPVYLIDALMEATALVNEPWSLEPRRKRLMELRKAYDERQAFWKRQALGKELQDQLLKAVHEPALRFWEVVEQRYLPAHGKGDKDGADNAFLAIAEAFEEHRKAVVEVAGLANRFSATLEAEAGARERVLLVIIGTLAAVVLAIVLASIGGVILGLVRPVTGIKAAMSDLAGGNLKTVIPGEGRRDEIGEMAKAVQVFRDAAIEKVRLERDAEEERRRNEDLRRQAEQEAITRERAVVAGCIGAGLSKLAAKDLTYRMTGDIPEAYRQLQADFNTAAMHLEQAMQGVTGSTGVIHAGSQEISSAADDLARRIEQQAAGLEQSTAALAQITATVKTSAQGADHAREIVASATGHAEQDRDVMRRAADAMAGIENSSQQIGRIIGVVDEIAFQTNLLALNAGVEAARAGDAGRGFAVVASEVRALAQRSATAAKEIKNLITTSTGQVEQGVRLVAASGTSLERIMAQLAEISTVVARISEGAKEQAGQIEEVNAAINQMDQMAQANAAMVEESTAASRSLALETDQLSQLVTQFSLGAHTRSQAHHRTARSRFVGRAA